MDVLRHVRAYRDQMDIKVKGITEEILRNALSQANAGRAHILGKMMETISATRESLSSLAPRVTRIKINPEKIGAIIGPNAPGRVCSLTCCAAAESTSTKR